MPVDVGSNYRVGQFGWGSCQAGVFCGHQKVSPAGRFGREFHKRVSGYTDQILHFSYFKGS